MRPTLHPTAQGSAGHQAATHFFGLTAITTVALEPQSTNSDQPRDTRGSYKGQSLKVRPTISFMEPLNLGDKGHSERK